MVYNYENLPPFKWFVLQNFPFIEEDFDAITNWQLFCALGEQINKVIDSVNLSGEQVEALTNAFNDLKNYVDNLDLQDEVNNKLDEMAESGQLQEIIAEYLNTQAIIGFNTISDMADSSLISGSNAYCLGKNSYNDGNGNFYKIRNITNTDIVDGYNIVTMTNDNTLVAERITSSIESDVEKIKNAIGSHKLNSTRIFRKILEAHENNYYSDPNTTLYRYSQGFDMIDENTAIISLLPDNATEGNNQSQIQIVNINNGNVLQQLTGDFGHLNSISYNPDDNLIYIAGLSGYVGGVLQESSNLLVINRSDMSYNTYNVGNVIGGVTYDKITKKLYCNGYVGSTHNLYELNKNNYTIENTTPLVARLGTGTISQTVTVHNSIVYYVTAYPNTIAVFDIEGNQLNKINLNRYADDLYYIGELEDISFVGDYLYFNSQTGLGELSNYSMLQICKTSLIYNVESNISNVKWLPLGTMTIYIDNTVNNVNPNGLSDNKFSNLFEANLFLNSPRAREWSRQIISLAETNNIYQGCRISSPFLKQIVTNNQTIGTCEFNGIIKLDLPITNFKSTVENYPVIKVLNSDISFRNPTITDVDSISTGVGILVENGKAIITNGNNSNMNGLTIRTTNINSFIRTQDYIANNIYKENGFGNQANQMYLLSGASINNDGTYNYSTSITDKITQINRYKYINFVLSGPNKKETIKFETTGGGSYRLNSIRSINSTSSNQLIFLQYTVSFDNTQITVANSKIINQSGSSGIVTTTNLETSISDIYLSDD